MTHRARLDRLRRIAQARQPAGAPQVFVWLPVKEGGAPPGRYPAPDGSHVCIVYKPEATV
jgi:hypothetical protein